jgi:actin-like ATPase involved in cell morphogenesis
MTYALGIDLGTTYTAAAVARNGRAEVAALGYRATSVPTVVLLTEDGRFLVGDAADRRSSREPSRVAREFKRRVGDPTPLLLGGTPIAVDRCLAEVLRWVTHTIGEAEGGPPSTVTVTHPANWGEYKQDVLREALRMVDLPGARLLPEPVAAATWYAQTERLAPGRAIAVYDLGGGTFDATVLRRGVDGRFESLGRAEGIERLGGIDVDEAVFAYVLRSVGVDSDDIVHRTDDDPPLATSLAQLRRACVEAKEALSSETSVTIPVWLPQLQHEVLLHRTELEELVGPLLGPTVEALARVVRSAGLSPADLDAVLLVGGSSRIPLITRQVSAGLGRPVAVDAHPKHPVALGAALDAGAHPSDAPAPAPAASAVATAAPGAPPMAPPGPPGPPGQSSNGWPAVAPGYGAAPGSGQSWTPAGTMAPGGPPSGQGFPPYRTLPPLSPPPPPAAAPADRRLLWFASLATPIVLVVVLIFYVLNSGGGDPTDETGGPGSSTATTGSPFAAPTTAGNGEPSDTTVTTGPVGQSVSNTITDPGPVLDGFAGLGDRGQNVYELVLYADNYSIAEFQVPGEPTHVDEYTWREGAVTGGDPAIAVIEEGEELESKFFGLSEIDPSVIPTVAQDGLQRCGEGLELTHVIIDRDIVFDDQQRVLINVYASNDYSDGGYVEYQLDGTFVENNCD